MCGRYSLTTDVTAFLEFLGVPVPEGFVTPIHYNIAPSQPVIGLVADPQVRLEVMEWGFIPPWSKPETPQKSVINARIESILENKPYYRGAFKSGRCVFLADGFYEWGAMEGGGKQPYRIGTVEGGLFAMAGLFSHPRGADGTERVTGAIITLPANEFMQNIHNRMPAILQTQDISVWLDPNASQRNLHAALEPCPPELMHAYRVSRAVNNPRNDDPVCIEPE